MQPTFHEITSLHSLISSAISTGQPLPPILKLHGIYDLSELLENIGTDEILSTRHVCEPGYAAFAVMQVATSMLMNDLEGLPPEARILVGEVHLSIEMVRWEDLEGELKDGWNRVIMGSGGLALMEESKMVEFVVDKHYLRVLNRKNLPSAVLHPFVNHSY